MQMHRILFSMRGDVYVYYSWPCHTRIDTLSCELKGWKEREMEHGTRKGAKGGRVKFGRQRDWGNAAWMLGRASGSYYVEICCPFLYRHLWHQEHWHMSSNQAYSFLFSNATPAHTRGPFIQKRVGVGWGGWLKFYVEVCSDGLTGEMQV